MVPRDQENPSQAPDLGEFVQLESEETLEGNGDALDAGYIPPDRPYGLDEDAVTGAGDSLDQRLRREEPEDLDGENRSDPDRAGRIVIADEGAALETPDGLAGQDVGIAGGAASAEEAAVHEVGDGSAETVGAPVETEPSVADAPILDDPELAASLAADPEADSAVDEALRDIEQSEGMA